MRRFIHLAGSIVLSATLLISCSTSSNVSEQTETTSQKVSKFPSWYPQQEFVSGDSELLGYATAIDADSASSIAKSEAWAIEVLKSSVSAKLEEVRSEALVEYGSESGLDEPRFLLALRKAKKAVELLAQRTNTEIKSVEGYDSVRGFVEVSVPKDQLIDRIGKRLGGHEKAWDAMKNSEAFSDF